MSKYDYKNSGGVRAAHIDLNIDNHPFVNVYFNGGGYFENAQNYPNAFVIGTYKILNGPILPVIIYIQYGKGHVILSGVNFEYNGSFLDQHDSYLQKIIPKLAQSNHTSEFLRKIIFKKMNLKNSWQT